MIQAVKNTVILIIKLHSRFSIDLQRIGHVLLHLSYLRSQPAFSFSPFLPNLTSVHLHPLPLHPALNQLHHFLLHLLRSQSLEAFPEILVELQQMGANTIEGSLNLDH